MERRFRHFMTTVLIAEKRQKTTLLLSDGLAIPPLKIFTHNTFPMFITTLRPRSIWQGEVRQFDDTDVDIDARADPVRYMWSFPITFNIEQPA